MSFDIYIVPTSDFLKWTDAQWEQYFNCNPPPESFQLGRSVYVGLALEAIVHNLEGDKAGSKFPLLMRIEGDEKIGWYPDEIIAVLDEIRAVKKGLAALPINLWTLNYSDHSDVRRRRLDFEKYHPGHPLVSLYDLNFHFIDTFETALHKAINTEQGLTIFY